MLHVAERDGPPLCPSVDCGEAFEKEDGAHYVSCMQRERTFIAVQRDDASVQRGARQSSRT